MGTPDENIATLQRWVDGYVKDVNTVQAGLFSGDMPEEARRLLVGALNYVLDSLDFFPDHYKGLGIADDAMVLRAAARSAVAKGADHAGLVRLAGEAAAIEEIFGPLAGRLSALVEKLPERAVRGRTADKILGDKDTRVVFSADLARELKRHEPKPIELGPLGAKGALDELARMLRHGLDRAGVA